MPTLRLTQRYQTTTTQPLSPVIRLSLCCHPSLSLPGTQCGRGCCLPHDRADQLLCSSVPFDDLHLENLFDDNGVSRQVMDEMLALQRDTFQRCLSAQQAPTALQRFNRRKCALLLRELAATADLPPHSARFSQQLLDLTHRWWTEREDPDIDINDVHPSQPRYAFTSSCIPRGILIWLLFSCQTPRQPARSLNDLLAAIAALQCSTVAFSPDGPRSCR